MASLGALLAGSDDAEGDNGERETWVLVPVVCVVVLVAGVVAGLVRALRADGSDQIAGVPLPHCSWLTSRWAVRIAACTSLVAGIFGLISAARGFILSRQDSVPVYLLSLTLLTYILLGVAPLITLIGLRFKGRGALEAYRSCGQAARTALMGSFAAGIATEMLATVADDQQLISREWRQSCTVLGASSGLLLLGLYAALADGTWRVRGAEPFSEEARRSAGSGNEAVENGPVRHNSINSAGSGPTLGLHPSIISNDEPLRPSWASPSQPSSWESPVQARHAQARHQTGARLSHVSPRRSLQGDLNDPLLGADFGSFGPPPHPGLLRLPSDLGPPASNLSFHSPEPSPGPPPRMDSEVPQGRQTSGRSSSGGGNSPGGGSGAGSAGSVAQAAWGGRDTLGPPAGPHFPREPALLQPVLAS